MNFYVVLNRPSAMDRVSAEAASGMRPRHSMDALTSELDAALHDGTDLKSNLADRLIGRMTRTNPLWWSIARKLRSEVNAGDVIYCSGEDVGLPVALLCGGKAKVAMTVHSADSLKKQIAFKIMRTAKLGSKFFAVSQSQVDALSRLNRVAPEKAQFLWDQTDTEFFSPGPADKKVRPMIMSIGLERRDYTTLAQATADLDIDVRISGFSADTRLAAQAFPAELPANMTRQFYSWTELRSLYRTADIAVVSLFPNKYAAGVQGLMEAMACGRPVIVTATEGLRPYLSADSMRIVESGRPEQLRRAIIDLLANPHNQSTLGENGRRRALNLHSLEAHVATLAAALRNLNQSET